MKSLGAVRKHRRRGFASEQPARIHLGDVSDEIGLVVALHQSGQPQRGGELAQLGQAIAVGDKPAVTRYRVTFGKGIGKGLVAGQQYCNHFRDIHRTTATHGDHTVHARLAADRRRGQHGFLRRVLSHLVKPGDLEAGCGERLNNGLHQAYGYEARISYYEKV